MNELKFKLSEDGCSVTGYEIQELEIPEGVTTIEKEVFSNMTALKRVKLPSTMETIMPYAFSGCEALEEINLPPALDTIWGTAFQHCKSLKRVIIEPGNEHFVVDKGILYTSDMSVIIRILDSPECSHIILTENHRAIISGALITNSNLRRFTINVPVDRIPAGLFYRCENLKQVDLMDGVQYIGKGAFEESGVENIVLPNTVKVIDEDAFLCCESLRHITIPDDVKEIRHQTFLGCGSLETVVVGKKLCHIWYNAFNYCSHNLQIIVPEGKTVASYERFSEIDDFVGDYADYKHDDAILFVPLEIADKIKGAKVLDPDETQKLISQINLDDLTKEDDYWYNFGGDEYGDEGGWDWVLDTWIGWEDSDDLDDDDTADDAINDIPAVTDANPSAPIPIPDLPDLPDFPDFSELEGECPF